MSAAARAKSKIPKKTTLPVTADMQPKATIKPAPPPTVIKRVTSTESGTASPARENGSAGRSRISAVSVLPASIKNSLKPPRNGGSSGIGARRGSHEGNSMGYQANGDWTHERASSEPLRLVWQGLEQVDSLGPSQDYTLHRRPLTFQDLQDVCNQVFREPGADVEDRLEYYFTDDDTTVIDESNWHDRCIRLSLLLVFDDETHELNRDYEKVITHIPHPTIMTYPPEYKMAEAQGEPTVPYALCEFIDNSLSAIKTAWQQSPANSKYQGRVSIECHEFVPQGEHRPRMRITVSDNGCGMSKKVLNSFARMADAPEDRGIERNITDADVENNFINVSISQFGVGAKSAGFYLGGSIYVSTRVLGSKLVHELCLASDDMIAKYRNTGNAFHTELKERLAGQWQRSKLPINANDRRLQCWLDKEHDREHFAYFVIDDIKEEQFKQVRDQDEFCRQLAGIYHRVLHGPWGRGGDEDNANLSAHAGSSKPAISVSYYKNNENVWHCTDLSQVTDDLQSVFYAAHRGSIFRFELEVEASRVNDRQPPQSTAFIRGEILYFPRNFEGESNPVLTAVNEAELTGESSGADPENEGESRKSSFQSQRYMFNLIWHGRLIPLSFAAPLYFMNSYGTDRLKRCHGFLHLSYPFLTDRVKLHLPFDLASYITDSEKNHKEKTVRSEIALTGDVSSRYQTRSGALQGAFRKAMDQWSALDATFKLAFTDFMRDLSNQETLACFQRIIITTEAEPCLIERGGLIQIKPSNKALNATYLRVVAVQLDLSAGKIQQLDKDKLPTDGLAFVIGFTEPLLVPDKDEPTRVPLWVPRSEESTRLALKELKIVDYVTATETKMRALTAVESRLIKLPNKLLRVPLRRVDTTVSADQLRQSFLKYKRNAELGYPRFLRAYESKRALIDGLVLRARSGYQLGGTAVSAWSDNRHPVSNEKVEQTYYKVTSGGDAILDHQAMDEADENGIEANEEESSSNDDEEEGNENENDGDDDAMLDDDQPIHLAQSFASKRKKRQSHAIRSSKKHRTSRSQSSTVAPVPAAFSQRRELFPTRSLGLERSEEFKHESAVVSRDDAWLMQKHGADRVGRGFGKFIFRRPGVYQMEYRLLPKSVASDREHIVPITISFAIYPHQPKKFAIEPANKLTLPLGERMDAPLRITMHDADNNPVNPLTMRGWPGTVCRAQLVCLTPDLHVHCEELRPAINDHCYEIDGLRFEPMAGFRLEGGAMGQEVHCRVEFHDDKNNELGSLDLFVQLTPGSRIELDRSSLPEQVTLTNDEHLTFELGQCDQFGQPTAAPIVASEKRPNKRAPAPVPYPRVVIYSDSELIANEWAKGKIPPHAFDSHGRLSSTAFNLPPIYVPPLQFLTGSFPKLDISLCVEWDNKRTETFSTCITVRPRNELGFVAAAPTLRAAAQPLDKPIIPSALNAPIDVFLQLFDESAHRMDVSALRAWIPPALHSAIQVFTTGLESVGDASFSCTLPDIDVNGKIPHLRTPKTTSRKVLDCTISVMVHDEGIDSQVEVQHADFLALLKRRFEKHSIQCIFRVECQLGAPHHWRLSFQEELRCGFQFDRSVSIYAEDINGNRVPVPREQADMVQLELRIRSLNADGNMMSDNGDASRNLRLFEPIAVAVAGDSSLVDYWTAPKAFLVLPAGQAVALLTDVNSVLQPAERVEFLVCAGKPTYLRAFLRRVDDGRITDIPINANDSIPDRVLVSRLFVKFYDRAMNEVMPEARDRALRARVEDDGGQLFAPPGRNSIKLEPIPAVFSSFDGNENTGLFVPFVLHAAQIAQLKLIISGYDRTTQTDKDKNPKPLELSLTVQPTMGRVNGIMNIELVLTHRQLTAFDRSVLSDRVLADQYNDESQLVLCGSSVREIKFDLRWNSESYQSPFVDDPQQWLVAVPQSSFDISWQHGDRSERVPYNCQTVDGTHWTCTPQTPTAFLSVGEWICSVSFTEQRPEMKSILSAAELEISPQRTKEIVAPGPPCRLRVQSEDRRVNPVVSNLESESRLISHKLQLFLVDEFSQVVKFDALSKAIEGAIKQAKWSVRPIDDLTLTPPTITFGSALEEEPGADCVYFSNATVDPNTDADPGRFELVFDLGSPFEQFADSFPFTFANERRQLEQQRQESERRSNAKATIDAKRTQVTARMDELKREEVALVCALTAAKSSVSRLCGDTRQLIRELVQSISTIFDANPQGWTEFCDDYEMLATNLVPDLAVKKFAETMDKFHVALQSCLTAQQQTQQEDRPFLIPHHLHFIDQQNGNKPLDASHGFVGVIGSLIWVEDARLCRAVSYLYGTSLLSASLVQRRQSPAVQIIDRQLQQARKRASIAYVEGQQRHKQQLTTLPHQQHPTTAALPVTGNPRYLFHLLHVKDDQNKETVRQSLLKTVGNTVVLDTMDDVEKYRKLLARVPSINIPTFIGLSECKLLSRDNMEMWGHNTRAPELEDLELRIAIKPPLFHTQRIVALTTALTKVTALITQIAAVEVEWRQQQFHEKLAVLRRKQSESQLVMAQLDREEASLMGPRATAPIVWPPMGVSVLSKSRSSHSNAIPRRSDRH